MYFLLTDETNLEPSKDIRFFVYGGLFFGHDCISKLDSAVRAIRSKYKFNDEDLLKFNTHIRPRHISKEDYTAAKNAVIDLCLEHECQFIAYVVHHKIATDTIKRITYAFDHVIKVYDDFLRESNEAGIVLTDNLPISNQGDFFKRKFQIGLEYPSRSVYRSLDHILLYGTTPAGASNLASLIDIVLGSFRYCINDPLDEDVAKTLFTRVLKMMWHSYDGDTRVVRERGLILRPSEITVEEYKQDYANLIQNLKTYSIVEVTELIPS